MDREGVLFTGVRKPIANDLGIFIAVEEEGVFYFVKSPETELLPPKLRPPWGLTSGNRLTGPSNSRTLFPTNGALSANGEACPRNRRRFRI
jgi:hypothetical protein